MEVITSIFDIMGAFHAIKVHLLPGDTTLLFFSKLCCLAKVNFTGAICIDSPNYSTGGIIWYFSDLEDKKSYLYDI